MINIISQDMIKEMEQSFLDYSTSVITGRALPDARDGLKPVHRRILYALAELNLVPTKPYKKSARIVGDVIGKYHPHGDSSVYEAMVRMAQDWSLRYPLVEGQGNFGSVDGDGAAAMRYTEARMGKITLEMLRDLKKDVVDFQPNFSEDLEEPMVLPSRIPNLLLNGTSGIAVGMACSFAPHNMNEVVDGIIATINNRDITVEEAAIISDEKQQLRKMLEILTPKEKLVIILRNQLKLNEYMDFEEFYEIISGPFKLEYTKDDIKKLYYKISFSYASLTLQAIGEYFGVTRERIRQVEAKALRKLKVKCQGGQVKLR